MDQELHVRHLSDDELRPKLQSLAARSRKYCIITLICFALFFIGLFLAFIGPIEGYAVLCLVIPAFIGAIVFGMFWSSASAKLKAFVGQHVIVDVLAEAFEDVEYSPFRYIDRKVIEAARLITQWNVIKGSDLVEGRYRDVKITFSDIELIEKKSSGKSTSSITKFRGQWLICELAKTLPASLRLSERYIEGRGGKSDVETENVAFNAKYRIKTSDKYTAFYVLTPHFMEYIMSMDERADALTYLGFMKSKVHIALHNRRDLFVVHDKKLMEGDGLAKLRKQVRSDIEYITDVLDELLLNEYLFRKAD